MISIRINEVIPNLDILEAYITFRRIEDWCTDNIPKGHWRFDYSSTLCVCGIDIPGRIFFGWKKTLLHLDLHLVPVDFTVILYYIKRS